MKSTILRFGFIAFSALSSVWGNSLQAQDAVNGGCDGRTSIHRKVTDRIKDTYWELSKTYYGTHKYWSLIAEKTGIEPRRLKFGDIITIPCWQETEEKRPVKTFVPSTADPTESVQTPQGSEQDWQEQQDQDAVQAPIIATNQISDEIVPVWHPVSMVGSPIRDTLAERKPTTETATATTQETTTAPTPHVEIALTIPKPGWYEMTLTPDQVKGIKAGTFPAYSLDHELKSGFWRQRSKTEVIVRETDGGFLCDMKFNTAPTSHSVIAFDLGEGNLVKIDGASVMQSGHPLAQPAPKNRRFTKKDYASLNMDFRKKPSVSAKFVGRVVPIAMPIGLGFAFGGLPGAAIGGGMTIAKSVIGSQVRKLQAPPQDQIAPTVSYVIADQASTLESLKAKQDASEERQAKMQKQLDDLTKAKKEKGESK